MFMGSQVCQFTVTRFLLDFHNSSPLDRVKWQFQNISRVKYCLRSAIVVTAIRGQVLTYM